MPSSNAANTPEIPKVPWQLLVDSCNHTASIVLLLYWLVLLSTLLKPKVHLSAQLTKQCVGIAEMGAKAEVAEMAMTYLRCRAIAAPISLAMFVATGSFRGFKDTRSAFQHMLTGSAAICSQGLQAYLQGLQAYDQMACKHITTWSHNVCMSCSVVVLEP